MLLSFSEKWQGYVGLHDDASDVPGSWNRSGIAYSWSAFNDWAQEVERQDHDDARPLVFLITTTWVNRQLGCLRISRRFCHRKFNLGWNHLLSKSGSTIADSLWDGGCLIYTFWREAVRVDARLLLEAFDARSISEGVQDTDLAAPG